MVMLNSGRGAEGGGESGEGGGRTYSKKPANQEPVAAISENSPGEPEFNDEDIPF